jgi:transcriptional regulator with XRE-family HTH domain
MINSLYMKRGVKMKPVNEIIRGIREDRYLTQTEVAAVLGVQQQYYSKYETGEYEVPVRHVITLAKFYNVTADYLLGIIDYGDSFEKLKEPLIDNITAGKIISHILSLNDNGRKAVIEYIDLMILKKLKNTKR